MSEAVKPFPVDEAVLAAIRPMQWRDVSRVVALHRAAMGDSLWARLGTPFLVALYRGLLKQPEFLGFVYEEQARVRGFIAGSENSSRLFQAVLRSEGRALVLPILRGLARDPSLAPLLATTPLYFRRSSPGDDIPAESMFCSFEPELRGRRVSGHINKVLFDELLARGAERVKISTDLSNADARRQLESWGFEERGRFQFYGKDMVLWTLDLTTSPRVQAVRRHVPAWTPPE